MCEDSRSIGGFGFGDVIRVVWSWWWLDSRVEGVVGFSLGVCVVKGLVLGCVRVWVGVEDWGIGLGFWMFES